MRRRYWVCAGVLACVFILLLVILRPTPDSEEFAGKQQLGLLPEIVQAQQPTWTVKLTSIISGAFLDLTIPSLAFVLLVGLWCAYRRKLLVFALPVLMLIGLYVAVHGYAHHHGTVTIAALTAMWIAWPGGQEGSLLSKEQRTAVQAMVACLLVFSAVNIWDSGVVIKREYLYPYSGAGDAARYLRANAAETRPIFGLLYGIVGIQAYFDRNIFANVHTTYFHHGLPLEGVILDADEVRRVNPDYIVAFSEQPQLMVDTGAMNELGPLGYRVVHFSDGYLLYKAGVYVRQTYFIFRKVGAGPPRS